MIKDLPPMSDSIKQKRKKKMGILDDYGVKLPDADIEAKNREDQISEKSVDFGETIKKAESKLGRLGAMDNALKE